MSADEAEQVLSRAATFCDVIIGNDEEFGFMAGGYDRGLSKARALAVDTAKIVVYKMGEKGAITITNDSEVRTGIFKTQAIKPTGAGDAFMAGFLGGLASGLTVSGAVERGSAAAALVVSCVGCAPAMPTADELAQFLSSNALQT
jgi:5-dehydro-2-deoxygluconokinase